jgi:Sigma-54 interaction domain
VALFDPKDWPFLEKVAVLVTSNPFEPEWMHNHQEALARPTQPPQPAIAWQPGLGPWGPTGSPRSLELGDRIESLVEQGRSKLAAGEAADERELDAYEKLALYWLYCSHGRQLDLYVDRAVRGDQAAGPALEPKAIWEDFLGEHRRLLALSGRAFPLGLAPEHVFACFFLFRRAFYHIFFNIVGASKPAAKLRSEAWQSIVTHDFFGNVVVGGLTRRMRDFATLITGPSGTGKELVAQAVGRSLYVPFDPKRKVFAADFLEAFCPVNLSALPPLLIESELFGHVKGAFSGAVEGRVGRLEGCPECGAVFLDEIGELNGELQVKLLRVLQERRFRRVGQNADLPFAGKVIAATNRDLAEEVAARRFREDLYYRLCADRIVTPSLREQLADRPADLPLMVTYLCRRVVGEEQAGRLCEEVVAWIERNLGGAYAWPGNFRELEQCVRSYAIRKEYHPLRKPEPTETACATLAGEVMAGRLSHEQIERAVFAEVYRRAGSYQEAARLLGVDWRTLRARVSDGGR